MKVFLTGATGFLGRSILSRLREHGHEVICWVRESSDTSFLKENGVKVSQGSLLDTPTLTAAMKGADVLIHNAGIYSFWEPEPSVYENTNVNGTFSVFSAAIQAGISRALLISSAVIYGKVTPQPFDEHTIPGSERFSRYAESKYFGEMFARKIARERSLPLTVIQPGAIIGPGDLKASGAYIANIIEKKLPAVGLSNSIITFVHVQDVAEAVISAIESRRTDGQTYLIGSQPISLEYYMKKISEISGVPLPKMVFSNGLIMTIAQVLTFFANRRKKEPLWGMSVDQAMTFKEGFQFDGSKAERELGLRYTPIDEAIEETVRWYLLEKQKKTIP